MEFEEDGCILTRPNAYYQRANKNIFFHFLQSATISDEPYFKVQITTKPYSAMHLMKGLRFLSESVTEHETT